MGYPIHTAFNLSPPGGRRRIARGLELALAENIDAQPETYTDRGAIVLLVCGADGGESTDDVLKQLRRASDEGIRVHYACLSTPHPIGDAAPDAAGWSECSTNSAMVPAILRTGGIVAIIDMQSRRVPRAFANMVMDRGLTATDDDDTPERARLYPGITIIDLLSPDTPSRTFSYAISAGEHLNLTVVSVTVEGQGAAEACFTVTLWDRGLDIKMATHTRCGGAQPLSLVYEATASLELVLVVEYGDAVGKRALIHQDELVFSLAVGSSMLDKDEATVKKMSTETAGSSMAAEVPGMTTALEALPSETLEVSGSVPLSEGSTCTAWTSWRWHGDGEGAPVYRPFFGNPVTCSVATVAARTMGPDGAGCGERSRDVASECRVVSSGRQEQGG
ncbi:uncharacterized protein THITE_2114224 [Thermothielavioides terrestris NRRL 8126]|uniref:Uncharacterized protein n=1 Tax=Thermothielavioides terrestris (strain ATCC 38088 / NRRL 8126) TaxID=578455 RepID=G2QYR4_THETT|nr:uncharacterized protein THITE_2114224 [Thermothielavioides terrestris NRRL 8126]AEO66256.1 hypothetical protein THITE_2114224 [Thermothielavioides terrestris NRRL 8126]